MIEPERILALNHRPDCPGAYVLYWMQQSQRAHWNHALEHAAAAANRRQLPLLVAFAVAPGFPGAAAAHYRFMLEGLRETAAAVRERGAGFVVRSGEVPEVVLALAERAAWLVTDGGYLRIQRRWRQQVADGAPCPVEEVESDVVVPVETASDKEEYSAATLRRKLGRVMDRFLTPVAEVPLAYRWSGPEPESLDLSEVATVVARLGLDDRPRADARGGNRAARGLLEGFAAGKLARYGAERSDPATDLGSGLSPYLHFGQISPLHVALTVGDRREEYPESVASFLEELIVRRELAINFVHFNPAYDTYDALPGWAQQSLAEHRGDARPFRYPPEALEAATTHDPYWNAAQREMVRTGRMHNYMRMYWGKKILEWSASPEEAFATALALNNRYELDGRDANGFAGVAWCFGKHDRGWPERPVFGKVRYMNANGLRRKFDIDAYVARVGDA